MANSRFYSSIAQQTTLTSGITGSGTTMIVAAITGFPGSLPYTLAVDYGQANEELVEVTGVAGTTLTVTRAIDGTSGASHNPGAVIRHVSSARDFTDSRTHEAASTNVHGLSGGAAVVGTTSTQTLTNKTVTNLLGSARNFKIFQSGGSQIALQVIGDSANPGTNRIEVLDDESSLNVMAFINSGGAIKSISRSGDATNVYRLRLTDNDGTTDRFAVLAGGTIAVSPNSSTAFVGVDIIAPDTNNSKRAIRVAASGGGTERFTVWNDGRVDIVGTDATFSTFDVTAPASVSTDIMRVLNSAASTQFAVQSTGRTLANKGATVAQPGVTSGPVLTVGGSNVGYTGNLQQWVDPANNVIASITEAGNASFSGNLTVSGIGQTLFAKKTGDTTRTSTTTATDDPHLVVAVAANATYEVSCYVVYNAGTTGDIGVQFGVPASATGDWSGVGWGRDATASVGTGGWTVRLNQNTITQNRTYGGDTTDLTIHMKGIVVTAGTSGNFSLQWAQAVSDGTGTIVRAPSYLVLRRVA